jgi:hypothetical protein
MATFQCRKCREYRPTKGRRMVVRGVSRFGYRCARRVERAEKRSQAKEVA